MTEEVALSPKGNEKLKETSTKFIQKLKNLAEKIAIDSGRSEVTEEDIEKAKKNIEQKSKTGRKYLFKVFFGSIFAVIVSLFYFIWDAPLLIDYKMKLSIPTTIIFIFFIGLAIYYKDDIF